MTARELEIEKGAMLKIDAAQGDRLHVRLGEVWVTQHADPNDYMLRAGESLVLRGKGPTLAVAYRRALVCVHRSERARKRAQATGVLTFLRRILAPAASR